MNLNLCLRPKAVDVVIPGVDAPPPVVPEDSALRGRAAELHRQLSHMHHPILVPRDQFIINFDFDLNLIDEPEPQPSCRPQPPPSAQLHPPPPEGAERHQRQSAAPVGSGAASASPPAGPEGDDRARAAAPPTAASPFAWDTDAAAAAAAGAAGDAVPGAAGSGAGQWNGGGGGGGGGGGRVVPAGPSCDGSAVCAAAAAAAPFELASWADGAGPHTRGFVRVKSVRPPSGLSWTHSRKCLEVLLAEERGARGGSGYVSQEQRLVGRLERLNLEMVVVEGDGNCQFRSISNELYGTQDHHAAIRRAAVGHIVAQREAFEVFLGEDFDQYVRQMERSGTWGDELTLRAVCDSFGLTIHVVTSEEDHWYLTYQPEERKLNREIFLTYIAPIHYNSIRRRSSLKTMALNVSRSFIRIGSASIAVSPTLAAAAAANGSSSGPASPSGGPSSSPVSPIGSRIAGGAGGGGGAQWSTDEDGGGRPERLRLPDPVVDDRGGGGGGGGGGISGCGGGDGTLLRMFRRRSP